LILYSYLNIVLFFVAIERFCIDYNVNERDVERCPGVDMPIRNCLASKGPK